MSQVRTERTIGPKIAPLPKSLFFGRKFEIRTVPVRRYPIYRRACQILNPSDTRFQSYRAPYFWSQKWASTKNPLCHAPDPDFIGGFCSCGGYDQILKISQKFIKQISCESASKFGAQKFNGPKKENLGLKKNFNGWRRYSYFFYFRKKNFRPGLRPVFSNTRTIGLMFFSYRISIYRTSEIGVATCNISESHLYH